MLREARGFELGEFCDYGRRRGEAAHDLDGFVSLLGLHDGKVYFEGLEHRVQALDENAPRSSSSGFLRNVSLRWRS